MIAILIEAAIGSFLLFGVTYLLFLWTARKGYRVEHGRIQPLEDEDEDSLKEETADDTSKKKKKKKKSHKTGHFALDKWMQMGGGFYGTVAFVKFLLIEVTQIIAFITDLEAIQSFFANFGIGTIVRFFVDQFKNFIEAIIWPTQYFGSYSWLEMGILFFTAYGAFRFAQHKAAADHAAQITR